MKIDTKLKKSITIMEKSEDSNGPKSAGSPSKKSKKFLERSPSKKSSDR